MLPSYFDFSPLVCSEAAAAGVPVVASNIAGIPEIVLDGKTGFLIEPGDETSYVEAVKTLLEDENLYKDFSNNAAKHYTKSLESEMVSSRLLRRISSCL